MTRTRWIIFALLCLGILGFIAFSGDDGTSDFSGDPDKVINQGPIKDHVSGDKDSKVVLIEYGDFQCPACRSMFPTVASLKAQYGEQFAFVFRNFPLTTIHPNALAGATAAEAAGLQDQFFSMHDLLYQYQDEWKDAKVEDRAKLFQKYAQMAGADIAQYKKDLAKQDIKDKIARDRDTAKEYGVNSTPTFVLNGKKLSGDIVSNPDKLTQAVQEAIAKNQRNNQNDSSNDSDTSDGESTDSPDAKPEDNS